MSDEVTADIIARLAPDGFTPRKQSEATYPSRDLAKDVLITRIAPSPTGMVHIGTVYTALLNERLAHQSGGVFILRIEDTDKQREQAGTVELIERALKDFGIAYDEGPDKPGAYGPYLQSERAKIYLGFAVELLKNGRAYPCFATPEELEAATRDQQTKKVRPGYYGQWALWREKPETDIKAALAANKPFVLRFRSLGSHDKRIEVKDALKGRLELPENDLDVPLIKSDGSHLPTYHLAHVVDDYLMRISLVLRGDEWLPSVPLHVELAKALNIPPLRYAHLAPISIIDIQGSGKRKLSKRKDKQADVEFWLKAGYPVEAIKAYLLGLANANFEDWYRQHPDQPIDAYPLSLEKLSQSRAPLLDMKKLEDYSKNFIARLPQKTFETNVIKAAKAKPEFLADLQKVPSYTSAVLAVERSGEKPRKDLAKWEDAYEQYGYFFDEAYERDFKAQATEFTNDFDEETVKLAKKSFLDVYSPKDTQDEWFGKLKQAAVAAKFADDNQAYKANPKSFKGSLADFARIIRASLTGKNRTPDLHTIMQIMGSERIKNRLS